MALTAEAGEGAVTVTSQKGRREGIEGEEEKEMTGNVYRRGEGNATVKRRRGTEAEGLPDVRVRG